MYKTLQLFESSLAQMSLIDYHPLPRSIFDVCRNGLTCTFLRDNKCVCVWHSEAERNVDYSATQARRHTLWEESRDRDALMTMMKAEHETAVRLYIDRVQKAIRAAREAQMTARLDDTPANRAAATAAHETAVATGARFGGLEALYKDDWASRTY